MDTEKKDNEIGSTVEVRFTNIPGSATMTGKVDTGADVSSLHSTEYEIKGEQVSFICPEMCPNKITVPLLSQQAVKSSDGGTEYRPVIALNVKVNGKLLTNVEFNLNDRGNMKFPILIGKNLLIKGGFKIDPRLDEAEEQPTNSFTNVTGIKPDDFNGTVHIYRVDKDTSDTDVNDTCTQQFAKVHLGNTTYIIRYLTHIGEKLNPEKDGDEILYLMDNIENELENKEKLQSISTEVSTEEPNDNT